MNANTFVALTLASSSIATSTTALETGSPLDLSTTALNGAAITYQPSPQTTAARAIQTNLENYELSYQEAMLSGTATANHTRHFMDQLIGLTSYRSAKFQEQLATTPLDFNTITKIARDELAYLASQGASIDAKWNATQRAHIKDTLIHNTAALDRSPPKERATGILANDIQATCELLRLELGDRYTERHEQLIRNVKSFRELNKLLLTSADQLIPQQSPIIEAPVAPQSAQPASNQPQPTEIQQGIEQERVPELQNQSPIHRGAPSSEAIFSAPSIGGALALTGLGLVMLRRRFR